MTPPDALSALQHDLVALDRIMHAEIVQVVHRLLADPDRRIPGLDAPAGGRAACARRPAADLAVLGLLARDAQQHALATRVLSQAEAHQRRHVRWCEEHAQEASGARALLGEVIAARGGAPSPGAVRAQMVHVRDALVNWQARRLTCAEPHVRAYVQDAGMDVDGLMHVWRLVTGTARPPAWIDVPGEEVQALAAIVRAEALLPARLRGFDVMATIRGYVTEREVRPRARMHLARQQRQLRGGTSTEPMALHPAATGAEVIGQLRAMLRAPHCYVRDPRSTTQQGAVPVRLIVPARGQALLEWCIAQRTRPGWQGLELLATPSGEGYRLLVTAGVGVRHGAQPVRLLALMPLGTVRGTDRARIERTARTLLYERGLGDHRPPLLFAPAPRPGVLRGALIDRAFARPPARSLDAALGITDECAHPTGTWSGVSVRTPQGHVVLGATLECPACLRRHVAFVPWNRIAPAERGRVVPPPPPEGGFVRPPSPEEVLPLLQYRAALLDEPFRHTGDDSWLALDPATWTSRVMSPQLRRATPSLRERMFGA